MASPKKVAKHVENEVIQLNVGGCLYTTSLSTLTRYPDSMLGSMFNGELDPSVRDTNGAFVMDRDGPIFRHVLNFLRHGKLILPEDFKEWELLASEADFYQVEALVEAVRKERCGRNATRSVNVGGCLYTLELSTLTRYPDSKLATMFTSELDPSVRDANGVFVLDRDGPIFRHVLNFLRQGKLILPEDFKEWKLLVSEANYYGVKPLADAVKKAKCRRVGSEEFIQLSVVPELRYTYIGNSSTLEKITRLYNFLAWLPGGMPAFTPNVQVTYTVKTPNGTNKSRHEFKEEAIIQEIKELGFQATKQSRTKNAKTRYDEDWSWTFSRRISG